MKSLEEELKEAIQEELKEARLTEPLSDEPTQGQRRIQTGAIVGEVKMKLFVMSSFENDPYPSAAD